MAGVTAPAIVSAVRAVPGSQWIGAADVDVERWWGEALRQLDEVLRREGRAPGRLIEWMVLLDEGDRSVRLFLETTARPAEPGLGEVAGLPPVALTTAGLGAHRSGGGLLQTPRNPL